MIRYLTATGLLETGKAVGRVGDAASDLKDATHAGFSEGVSAIADYQNSTGFRQASLAFQKEKPDLVVVLNNKDKATSKEYQDAIQGYTDYVQEQMGTDKARADLYDDTQIADKDMVGKNGLSKDGYGMTDNTPKYPNARRRK